MMNSILGYVIENILIFVTVIFLEIHSCLSVSSGLTFFYIYIDINVYTCICI